jgi:hypothetical protein
MLDFDGVVGSCKPVVDALVYAGVLKDDSWNVVGAWKVDQVSGPRRPDRSSRSSSSSAWYKLILFTGIVNPDCRGESMAR